MTSRQDIYSVHEITWNNYIGDTNPMCIVLGTDILLYLTSYEPLFSLFDQNNFLYDIQMYPHKLYVCIVEQLLLFYYNTIQQTIKC